jgi:hypothetical protein
MIVVALLAAFSAAVTWVVRDRQRLMQERDHWKERALNRAEAMAWMEKTRQAEEEADRYRSMLSAAHSPLKLRTFAFVLRVTKNTAGIVSLFSIYQYASPRVDDYSCLPSPCFVGCFASFFQGDE